MIGRLVDSLVGIFAPASAVQRAHSRRVYNQIRTRGYDAAKSDRLNGNWKATNRSADLEMLADADKIRARARDLVQNNAYAVGVLRAIVRNVVGCGIKPEPRVELPNGDADEMVNSTLVDLWDRWQKVCDVTGRQTFYEMQRSVEREIHEAGEVLVNIVHSDDPTMPLPMAIELIEADRIASDMLWFQSRARNPENGNEVRRGIEIDAKGKTVAYWLYPSHPNDLNTWNTRPERRPAENIIHLFKQNRIGQTRGMSSFAPVVLWLKNLHYYLDNELQASAVASCFTAAVTTLSGPADGGLLDTIDTSGADTDGNSFEYLQPGMVARLLPGEDIKTIDPGRPNSAAEPWIALMLRSLAVGTGISYERLVRDYSKTTFSSNRAGDLEDQREFRPEQEFLISHLCEPIWNRFVIEAVKKKIPGTPSAVDLIGEFHRFTKHVWQPPGWEWVDPKNDAAATETALRIGTTTLDRELGRKGMGLLPTIKQQIREELLRKQLRDEAGLEDETNEESESNEPERETAAVA